MWIGAQLEPKRQIENVQHGPPLSVPWCSLLVSEHKTHVPNSGNTKSSQPLHPAPSYSYRAPLPGLCTVASPLAQVGDNTFFFIPSPSASTSAGQSCSLVWQPTPLFPQDPSPLQSHPFWDCHSFPLTGTIGHVPVNLSQHVGGPPCALLRLLLLHMASFHY